jgi:dTDP-4-dehydrorhamnose 3,5-epimerase
MNRFIANELPLEGLKLIARQPIGDQRGYLARLFCADELSKFNWTKPIAQINHTYTAFRGTVRGLHFQNAPHTEMKLVSCLKGEVWDVAVDLRPNSPSFLQWHAEILSENNFKALLIPEGFAHGFQSMSDDVELLYCHSASYAQKSEAALNALDPRLSINWPSPITEISAKDTSHPFIDSKFKGVQL